MVDLWLIGRVPGSEDGDVVTLARQFVVQRSHEVAAEVAWETGVVVGEDGDMHGCTKGDWRRANG
jgi:hypothetical protein